MPHRVNPPKVPRQKFVENLFKTQFPEKTKPILEQYQVMYRKMLSETPPVENTVLDLHQRIQVLPGAALYLILREHSISQHEAKALLLQYYQASFRFIQKCIHLLGRVPFFPWLFTTLISIALKKLFPPPGWEIEIIESNRQQIIFNMHTCFYVDIVERFGIGEIAHVFCDLDHFINDEISPYISWERSGTIGGGCSHCDFQFYNQRFLTQEEKQ